MVETPICSLPKLAITLARAECCRMPLVTFQQAFTSSLGGGIPKPWNLARPALTTRPAVVVVGGNLQICIGRCENRHVVVRGALNPDRRLVINITVGSSKAGSGEHPKENVRARWLFEVSRGGVLAQAKFIVLGDGFQRLTYTAETIGQSRQTTDNDTCHLDEPKDGKGQQERNESPFRPRKEDRQGSYFCWFTES